MGSRELRVWPDLLELLSCESNEASESFCVHVEQILLLWGETGAGKELLTLLDVKTGTLDGLPTTSK